jgi:hypothetical protein
VATGIVRWLDLSRPEQPEDLEEEDEENGLEDGFCQDLQGAFATLLNVGPK